MKNLMATREEAWRLHNKNEFKKAEALYKQLITEKPEACDVANLGAVLRRCEREQEAMQLYQQWMSAFIGEPDLTLNAVNCAIQTKQFRIAGEWIQKGIEKNKQNRKLWKAKTRLLIAENRTEDAIIILEAMKKEKKDDIEVLQQVGQIHYMNQNYEQALNSYKEIAKIEPENIDNVQNLITTLQICGKSKFISKYTSTLPKELVKQRSIRAAIAYTNLMQNKLEEASKEFEKLCSEDPKEPLHWLNYCACNRLLKKSNKALAIAKIGVELSPSYSDLKYSLSQCLAELGKTEEAVRAIEKELKKVTQETRFMYNLQYLGEGYKAMKSTYLKDIAFNWEKQQAERKSMELWKDRITNSFKTRKIVIGYLSADFSEHPVGRFIKPVLRNHDKNKITLVGIHCGEKNDEVTNEIRGYCNIWKDITKMSDEEAARVISELRIDILIELGGYTAKSRIRILVQKPARIQMSYLGYFGPTYLKCIEYWIGDKQIFSKLNQAQSSAHTLSIIEGGYMCYEDKELPSLKTIKTKNLRLGCFNHSRKLSKQSIDLFCKIIGSKRNIDLVLKKHKLY